MNRDLQPPTDDLVARLESGDWLDLVRRAEAAPPLDRLGRFELLEEAGRGGQGVVYRALDTRTRSLVAVKRMLGSPESASLIERIRREAEVVATLDHPSIVRLDGVQRENGHWLLVMPWVDGLPLDEWAGRHEATPRRCVHVVATIADALAHAHQRGIIHRDLKPSNILVDGAGTPHVLDFGLAKVVAGSRAGSRTQGFVGTPAFASPEQRDPAAPLDVRSDVYSLGVVLRELLAGSSARMPADLDAVVATATAEHPSDRYQSMEAFREDLVRVLEGEPALARWGARGQAVRSALRRFRVPIAAAGAALVALACASVVLGILWRRSEENAARAESVQTFLESVLSPAGSGAATANASLLDLLADARRRIDAEFPADPVTRARLHLSLQDVYVRLWRWRDVAAGTEQTLPVVRAAYGPRSPEYASALSGAGLAAAFLDDERATAWLREALAIRREVLPEDDARITTALANLALARWRVRPGHDLAEAERLYLEALARFERAGVSSIRWGSALYSYGAMLTSSERGAEAVPILREALAQYDRLPGGFDLHRAQCSGDLGRTLLALDRPTEAERALRESVDGRPESARDTGYVWTWVSIARIRLDLEQPGAQAALVEALAADGEISGGTPAALEAMRGHAERIRRAGRVTGSDLDALEAIPGAEWAVAPAELRELVTRAGA